MEARAKQPKRQVELGRQDEHEKRLLERETTIEQAQADLDGHDGCAYGGDHLLHERRKERHAQYAQRPVAKAVADLCDNLYLVAGATEQLERRQSLQRVQKVRAHARKHLPLPPRQCIGQVADEDHKHRDDRRSQQQHQAGDEIEGKDKNEERHRHKDGQRELWKILAKVSVKRLNALDRRVDQFTAALAVGVGWSQSQNVRQEPPAQIALDPTCHAMGRHFAGPYQHGASDGHQNQGGERKCCAVER